jgi:hypothetical protein
MIYVRRQGTVNRRQVTGNRLALILSPHLHLLDKAKLEITLLNPFFIRLTMLKVRQIEVGLKQKNGLGGPSVFWA